MSMDKQDPSYWILDTGVSENIFSKHYNDQYKGFKKGQYIEMKYGYDNLAWNSKYKLELKYE